MPIPLLRISDKLIINWLNISTITIADGQAYIRFGDTDETVLNKAETAALMQYMATNADRIDVASPKPPQPENHGNRFAELVGDG